LRNSAHFRIASALCGRVSYVRTKEGCGHVYIKVR
jgi:hypothetical protein